ncbi:MAG: helix-turn-helix transcriptional regulator [Lachnospiraceae bacterium]|nr:helix-turn-helix transcriptional regulator [Lachnospiraceae bacterium]
MKLCDMNPHLRFASQITYKAEDNPVKVTDCRIFYTGSGSADIFIENQHYSLSRGSLFYCCGGSQYNIKAPEGFSPLCLNFDLTQQHNAQLLPFSPVSTAKGIPDIAVHFDPVEDSPFLNSHFYLQDGSCIYPYIEKILAEFSGNGAFFREICSSKLKELLIELHRVQKSTTPSTVEFIIKYMEDHYEKDLNNKELAALAGYHEYHLNRLFLAGTGTNLHNYLLKVRLNHASYLILNTDIPLKEIPEKVGFHNYPHFSSYFKQQFGFSPAQYRRHLKDNI